MSNRIVIKAKDANIVKNEQTKPGCEIQIDDADPAQLVAAVLTEPEATTQLHERLKEQGWTPPAGDNPGPVLSGAPDDLGI